MNLFKFFITIFLIYLSFQAQAKQSCQMILSASQVEALSLAQEGEFIVKVLERVRDDGTAQNIVYLAEKHLKSGDNYKLGQNVLNEFYNRGMEGVDPNNYWLSKLFLESLKRTPDKSRTHGSTKDAAYFSPEFVQEVEQGYIEKLSKMIENGKITREKALKQLDIIIKEQGNITSGDPTDPTIIMNQLVNWENVKEKLTNPEDSESLPTTSAPAPQIQIFELEANHRPLLRENLQAARWGIGHLLSTKVNTIMRTGYGILVLSIMGPLALEQWSNLEISQQALQSTMLSGSLISVGTSVLGLFSPFLKRGYSGQKSLESRDRTMVRNIQNALDDHPEIDTLLVTVGQAHVNYQVQLLEENGYEQIEWLPPEE